MLAGDDATRIADAGGTGLMDPGSVHSSAAFDEQRLHALLDNSADAVAVLDADGRYRFVSSAMERLFGWSPAQLVGCSYLEHVLVEDRQAAAVSFAEIAQMAPGDAYTATFRMLTPSGLTLWAEVTTTNHLANPAVQGIVANVRDVSERLEAEVALRTNEARFRSMMSGSFDVTALIDRDGQIDWLTPNCEAVFGYRPDELIGRVGIDLVHPDDQALMLRELALFSAGQGVPSPWTVRLLHRDGRFVYTEVIGTDFLDHPDIRGIAVNLRDIGERVLAELERERLTDIFDMTTDLVSISRIDGPLVYLNETARRFLGVGPDFRLTAQELTPNLTAASLHRLADVVFEALRTEGIWTGELDLIDRNRRVVPVSAQVLAHRDAAGRIEYVSTILHDISERKSFERRLAHEATHDPLTGLPNRLLLLDRLSGALERGWRHGTGVAVLFCDLDHFKVVNDSLGHSFGDRVLVDVARRLQEQLRPGDTVSRFGGDEFVILCDDCVDADAAVQIAKRVDDAMAHAFRIDGDNEVFVGLSMGIAMAQPSAGSQPDPESLIRDADAAMYRAKERGRGRHQVFERGIYEQAVDRFDLANALRRAVGRGELDVHYQPIVALARGAGRRGRRIVGVEALVRWDHPQRGRLQPGEFVPVAEETGVVLGMGAWVLEAACEQMARWQRDLNGSAPLTLAVNISGRQLEHPELVDVVERVIASTGLHPGSLELEVTESVLMNDVELSTEILATLKGLGVNISVDDFGTGYSSLSYLRRFPVDRLKVDRSFVDGLGSEPEDSAIVAAIVSLAHTLGLVAVGEGVETAVQLEALRGLGCDLAQGYHLAHPMAADDLTRLLLRQG